MKYINLLLVMLLAPLGAQATSLLDMIGNLSHHDQAVVNDGATLVTLEPKQNEIYPVVGAGSDFLVTVMTGDGRWLSRRALENGDPLNRVVEGAEPDSVHWQQGGQVSYLTDEIGSLGLWQKPVGGRGLVKRIHQFAGRVVQAFRLANGDMIAVRSADRSAEGSTSGRRQSASHRPDPFDNWTANGSRAFIVRIGKDGEEKRLSGGANPALSPDGKWIVFSMAVGRSRHLFIMRDDGSELAQLTDIRSVDVQPVWSPDGQWIAFTSNRGKADMRNSQRSNWDVWLVRRDGTTLMRITSDPARDGGASFTPVGDALLFHSDRKISKQTMAAHEVKRASAGFHIWRQRLPKRDLSAAQQ